MLIRVLNRSMACTARHWMSVLLFLTCCVVAIESTCNAPGRRDNSTCHGRVTCSSCITVSWFERVPYVYGDGNTTKGILPDILKMLLQHCCGHNNTSCWQIHHNPPTNDTDHLLLNTNTAHVIYPTIVDLQGVSNTGSIIGLIPAASIAFVVPKGERHSFPKKLLLAVFEAWPVLILTLLLSLVAGMLLWAMEIKANPDEFPRSFFKGSWEGFWWAFVSMTTVGYGDRSPRSFLGRVFAVAWILLGICIVSIFTATLTTSLTTITLDTKKTIPGTKIGVLERSIEFPLAMQQQANVYVYSTIQEIRDALDSKAIEGTLLDNYLLGHHSRLFPSTEFKVDAVIKQDGLAYGAIVNDKPLGKCFVDVLTRDQYLFYNFISTQLRQTVKSSDHEAVRNSQSIFDPTGDLFYPSLYTCIVLVIVIFLFGAILELVYLNPSRCVKNREGCYSLSDETHMTEMKNSSVCSQVDELEQQMTSDLHAMFKSYRSRLETLENHQSAA